MRPLSELLTGDPAWPILRDEIRAARNEVRIVPCERSAGEQALSALQVTDRSALGAVALNTGGLLVDRGWIRVLGAPSDSGDHLLLWLGPAAPAPRSEGFLVVAHDVVGGFFALDGGALEGQPGEACYLAPNTLQWEGLGKQYSGLIDWMLNGDLGGFYETLRWSGWELESAPLASDQALHLTPPPWTVEGRDVSKASRRAVPIREIWSLTHDLRRQLDGV